MTKGKIRKIFFGKVSRRRDGVKGRLKCLVFIRFLHLFHLMLISPVVASGHISVGITQWRNSISPLAHLRKCMATPGNMRVIPSSPHSSALVHKHADPGADRCRPAGRGLGRAADTQDRGFVMSQMSDVSPREPARSSPPSKLFCSHLTAFKQAAGGREEQGGKKVEDDPD